MKTRLLIIFCLLSSVAYCQYPSSFTWKKYITTAPDQLRQEPCFTFASVGAVEAMYGLSFGNGINLSERHAYSCASNVGGGGTSIQKVMQYINTNGVVTAGCVPYPSVNSNGTAIPCDSMHQDYGPYQIVYKSCSDIQTDINNCSDKRRVKANYLDVTNEIKNGNEAIKSILVNKGPIAISFEAPQLHGNAKHSYVLHGWSTSGGKLYWRFRDSWPCKTRTDLGAAVDLPTLFNGNPSYKAFIATQVWEERYNASSGWYNANLAIAPFELESENQIAKINAPSTTCYNEGTYTISNLLPGSVLLGWSLRFGASNYPNYNATISSSGYLSGDAENVTIVATILRANGLKENITKHISRLGIPFYVEKRSDVCFGNRREINLFVNVAKPANCNCSVTMNFPTFPNGYVINSGVSAYVVSTVAQGINYSVTVTCQKTTAPACPVTKTLNTFVVAMPCGGYYRGASQNRDKEEPAFGQEAEFPEEQEGVVFPNPAEGILKIRAAKTNKMRLINSFGYTVYQADFTGSTEVDISKMTRGMYIVEILSEDRELKRTKVVFN